MNIQQTIIEGIKEQLFLNDFMVLPDFGGFVLKTRPSHFSPAGAQLMPPAKTVSFNVQFRQNDGIMALWLSKKIGCTTAEALAHLKEFAEYCTGLLQTKRRLTIHGIGFFFLDFENNICFEPQKDVNFLRTSFGLVPLSITPLAEEAVQPRARRQEILYADRQTAPAVPAPSEAGKRNIPKLILPVAIALLLCSMVLLVLSGSRLSGELRSSLGGSSEAGIYQPMFYAPMELKHVPPATQAYVADANGIATMLLGDEKVVHVDVAGTTSRSGGDGSAVTVTRGNYEVVLGCFSVQKNAHKLVRELARARISATVNGPNHKDLYVVSQVNFLTRSEALSAMEKLRTKVPGAWIKKIE